jgi:hypothetical protein
LPSGTKRQIFTTAAKWSYETITLRKGERWTDKDKKNEIRLVENAHRLLA